VDIRKWLPGEEWDSAAFAYRRPAVLHQDQGRATLPPHIKPGTYILALAILDRLPHFLIGGELSRPEEQTGTKLATGNDEGLGHRLQCRRDRRL
jgi:hypothetical protein